MPKSFARVQYHSYLIHTDCRINFQFIFLKKLTLVDYHNLTCVFGLRKR